jgi:energy-coupling factor transport system permease protein
MNTLHPLAWAAWITATVIALTVTRNPWQLALILLIIALIHWRQFRQSARANEAATLRDHPLTLSPSHPLTLLRLGLLIVAVSALFNVLMVHVGERVLLRLPAGLPLVGGPLTLEALVYGALNGLVLAGLLAAFGVLNRVLPVRALLRLVPRAYYPVAVVMSIAVTFAPSTLQQVQQVREAQAVRGRRLAGLGSWLPLLVPVLEGSLERSMQLAEAMVARGFAGGEAPPDRRAQALMLLGMGLWLVGWLLQLIWRQAAAGWLLLGLGAALLLLGLWLGGLAHPHTDYRPPHWHTRDVLVAAAAAATALAYLLPWSERTALFYYPYPALTWPALSWPLLAATLGLAGPLMVRG